METYELLNNSGRQGGKEITDLDAEFAARIPSAAPKYSSQDVASSDVGRDTSVRDRECQGSDLLQRIFDQPLTCGPVGHTYMISEYSISSIDPIIILVAHLPAIRSRSRYLLNPLQ